MSWWDSKGLASFASQALKTAQKSIDKVLDIQEGSGENVSESLKPEVSRKVSTTAGGGLSSKPSEDNSFWNTWLGENEQSKPDSEKKKEKSQSESSSQSDLKSSPSSTSIAKVEPKAEKVKSAVSLSNFESPELQSSSKIRSSVEPMPLPEAAFNITSNSSEPVFEEDSMQHSSLMEEDTSGIIDVTVADDSMYNTAIDISETDPRLSGVETPARGITAMSDWSDVSLSVLVDSQIMSSSTINADPFTTSVHPFSSTMVSVHEHSDSDIATDKPEFSAEQSQRVSDDIHQSDVVEETSEASEIDCELANRESAKQLDVVDVSVCGQSDSVCTDILSEVPLQQLETDDMSMVNDADALIPSESSYSELTLSGRADSIDSSFKTNSTCKRDASAGSLTGDGSVTMSESEGELTTSDQTVTDADTSIPFPTDTSHAAVDNTQADREAVELPALSGAEDSNVSENNESQRDATIDNEMRQKSNSLSSEIAGEMQNMLEDAMAENENRQTADSPMSLSDAVRVESAQSSGHDSSAEEIETTASSDIEVISQFSDPNSNGEFRAERPFNMSPLRLAYTRSTRSGHMPHMGHRKTDSGSSGYSLQSKTDTDDMRSSEMAPVQFTEDTTSDGMVRSKPQPRGSNADTSERCKADAAAAQIASDLRQQESNIEIEHLTKRLMDMTVVVEAREKRLMELSMETMGLQETNAILRTQLQEAEELQKAKMADTEVLMAEFTKRISESERKCQTAVKEKELLKKQLKVLESDLTKKSDCSSTMEMLVKEKEEQVSQLLEEGEKLSKQQLQNQSVIKKLRAKEKENESLIKSLKSQVEEQTGEVERLHKILEQKVEQEKKHVEIINQLNTAVKRQETEIAQLKSDAEDTEEKRRGMQTALDNAYKEIGELHKASAMKASEVREAALSAALQAREELQWALDKEKQRTNELQELVEQQVEDCRMTLSRSAKEHARAEALLRQEVADLQQRLQEAELRNQDLSQNVSSASRPLLRQIENLQATYTAQTTTFERVEKNLTERLSDAQMQLSAITEKERMVSDQLLEATTTLTSLKSQVSGLRQEKAQLLAQLEMERSKREMAEDAKNSDSAQFEALKHCYEHDLSELKKEKVLKENQLEMEKLKAETDKKKIQALQDQLRDKEMQMSTYSHLASPNTLMSRSLNIAADAMTTSQRDDLLLDKSLMVSSAASNRQSLYDSLRQSGAVSMLVENLQSELKQREGEIAQLQRDIAELERTREAMASELVALTAARDALQDTVAQHDTLQKEYQDLLQRYNALLQMYGEKVEEANEMRMDLQDVKDMYKNQINQLLSSR